MSGLRDRNACDRRVGEETMRCYCLPNVEICLFSLYLDVSLDTVTQLSVPPTLHNCHNQHFPLMVNTEQFFFINKYFIPTVLNKVFVLRATELKVIIITYFNQIFCLKRFCCFQS